MATPSGSSRVIRFGAFELDVSAGELRKRGIRLSIQGLPLQLLAILADKPGQLVTREELRSQLWPADTFVDFDHSIRNAVARLRDALGDSAGSARYIETLPRRGYRFMAQVGGAAPPRSELSEEVSFPPLESPPRSRVALSLLALTIAVGVGIAVTFARQKAVPPIHSLAVLPFENLTGKPDQDYFADGMTDELITTLAKIGSVRVISRTSSMHYKTVPKKLPEIAHELNVDAVVEGSVSTSANTVRVTVQLIDAHRDRHLWAQDYNQELGNTVTLQNQVARDVAGEIQAKLTAGERGQLSRRRPLNLRAYEAYLKGRFHFNKRTESDMGAAIDYFNQAIAADPRYALPYVGLADTYISLGSWVFTAIPPSEAKAKAMLYAEKALAIDDTLGEAHASLGDAKLLFDCDWEGAEAEFKRGIALSPNYANTYHWYGELLRDVGLFDESIRKSVQAKELDPLGAMMTAGLAHRLSFAGRLEESIRASKSVLELDPNLPLAHMDLGETYTMQGNYDAAINEFKTSVEVSNGNPNFVADLGYVYAVSGRKAQAIAILHRLEQMSRTRYVPSYQLAAIYSGLGENPKTLALLDEAYNERSPWLNNLYVDHRFRNLRDRPEFARLLKALRFAEGGARLSP